MNKDDPLKALTARLGYPKMATLSEILAMLVTPDEATWLLALPSTPTALAAQIGKPRQEMAEALRDLFMRGLVIVMERSSDGLVYQLPTSLISLMDHVLLDSRYDELGEGFLDLWRTLVNDEFLPAMPADASSGMRVIPVESTIKVGSTVLPHEQVSEIIRSAERIAVQQCPCRKRERQCDNPLELCFSLDDSADYVLFRNVGRELTTDEALGLLLEAEQRALIHQVDDMDQPSVICNCCHCCCGAIRGMVHYDKPSFITKSRYLAVVDQDLCSGCELCLERCYVGALAMVAVEGVVAVDAGKCIGCGLCASVCPSDALVLTKVRDAAHIPSAESGASPILMPLLREAPGFDPQDSALG